MLAGGERQAEEVIGREQELDALAAFVDDVEARPAALVIEGEAGAGKTTLWQAAISAAEQRGHRVLAASGAPGEMQMAFAGLADLLQPVLEDVLPQLPPPQRKALEVTLLLEESPAGQSPRTVSAALLTSLRVLAESEPLLVAVDDVHWLDPASAASLAFAVRRLREEPVALLLALRTSDDATLPFDFARTSFGPRVQRLDVGPLSFGALRRLIQTRTGARLTRPVLLRVYETSGGNPFFALELVRALGGLDAPPGSGEPLPVPSDLGLLLADSIAKLPTETREAALVCALLAHPTLESISLATGESAEDALRPAFDGRILEIVDGSVRFSHALLRSAVYGNASPVDRLVWHRRLAEVATDVEERAKHLALSSDEPDEEVAAQLEQAGRRARARGAQAAAAGLLEHAIRLTPQEGIEDRARRRIVASDGHLESGERRRAAELLEEVCAEIPHGPLRVEALLRLCDTDITDNVDEARSLCTEGLREADGEPRLEAQVLMMLASIEHLAGEREAAVDYSLRALSRAEEIGDSGLTARALTGLGIYEAFLGVGDPEARYRRALDLEQPPGANVDNWMISGAYFAAGTMLSDWQTKGGELDEARSLLEEQQRRALETGDEESRMQLCSNWAELEIVSGRFEAARRWAEEGLALVEETDARQNRATMLCDLAAVEAYEGNYEPARRLGEEAKAITESVGDVLFARKARDILCFLELSAGRYDAALAEFGDPGVDVWRLPCSGDKVEALIGIGRTEEAEAELAKLEERAVKGPRVVRLLALRCRGLFTLAQGDLADALQELEQATTLARELPLPLERGRTLLLLGQARRRAKQKRAAREALEEAHRIFKGIGAERWAERAQTELGRIGGRRRERWELTPTEERVAELVAQGLTNKEVAAALVTSVRAVEANLTRIYRKLDIRSRTELAHLLAGKETEEKGA